MWQFYRMEKRNHMKTKVDVYLQGFIYLLQILSIVAIKIQTLTKIFQSRSQIPFLQVK